MNLIGTWKESEYSGQSVPVAGLAYLVTAPSRYCILASANQSLFAVNFLHRFRFPHLILIASYSIAIDCLLSCISAWQKW